MPAKSAATKKANKKAAAAGNFQAETVLEPRQSDILCGKDKACVAWCGSVRFRKMIDQYRERYCSDSTSKQQRMAITKEIVTKLSKSARFLKYDNQEGVWKTINALAARDKVSHALRFANLKENRRTGKVKSVRRRVSTSSSASSSSSSSSSSASSSASTNSNHAPANNKATTSPEDVKLWNSLVTRQSKLLESIKRGEKGSIPAIVEFPEIITVTPEKKSSSPAHSSSSFSEVVTADCDPLSINYHIDSSFVVDPTFQDYCMNLYHSTSSSSEEESATRHHPNTVPDDSTTVVTNSYQYRDEQPKRPESDDDTASDDTSNTEEEEDRGDEIASMITEPLMEWDLEHDGIFEV